MTTRDIEPNAIMELGKPVVLLLPDLLVASAWLGHIPFAFWLMDAVRPLRLVELGTQGGASYAAFLQAATHLELPLEAFAIDTWKGDPHAGPVDENVFNTLSAYHDRRYGAFSTLLRMTFDEAIERFADASIDLLHIDGYHTYDAVSHDLATWLPKLSRRGVIILHDIAVRTGDFGAWRLWAEQKARYPSFEFTHGYGLGVLAVGPEASSSVAWLTTQSNNPAATYFIRDFFARLGDGVIERFMRQSLEDDLQKAAIIAAERDGLLGALRKANEEICARDRALVEAQQALVDAKQASQHLRAIESSTSWRITAPLRSIRHRLGRWFASPVLTFHLTRRPRSSRPSAALRGAARDRPKGLTGIDIP